jgi:uncharacterized protein (DUF1330 family)
MTDRVQQRDAGTKPAYLVAVRTVHDAATLKESARQVAPRLEQFGGEILGTSRPLVEIVEGSWSPGLVVVQRWPSRAPFHAFVASEAYRPVKALRQHAATSALVLFEGRR